MIRIGEFNNLKPSRMAPHGLYLQDSQGTNILLPRKYVPEELNMDALMRVFIYRDNENRPIATTLKPFVTVGNFAGLFVRQITPYGAFLDWGLEKDLLSPHREQEEAMAVGKRYLIYLYLDPVSGRLVATGRLKRFLIRHEFELSEGEEVDLMVWRWTDLGLKVVVNRQFEGLIYRDELFRRIGPGESLRGFVKKVREDGKLDIALEPQGVGRIEPAAQKVLDHLRLANGFLPLHDKSDPELIKRRLEMSKKTFKKAIGSLYREQRIVIEAEGIRLVTND
ncbi:MAG: S1-like domain-containing RNA-binding protein [Bacteroidota bacterium]